MHTRETFLRRPAVNSQSFKLAATIYNTLRLLFLRNQEQPVFVPVRSLQYQAVIDRDEVLWIDSLGGYGYCDGVGGRLITLAWQGLQQSRHALHQPVILQRVDYQAGLDEVQRRLCSELGRSLQQQLDKQQPQAELNIFFIQPKTDGTFVPK